MTDISTKRYNLDNFEASFREFLQNKAREGQAAPLQNNSIKNYLSDLRHFKGWFTFHLHSKHERAGQAAPLQENPLSLASMIDFEAVSSYKVYLESNALPIKTINRRLSTLRKFCTFCIQQNWMKENVAKRVGNVGVSQFVIPAKARIQNEKLNGSRVVARVHPETVHRERDDNALNQNAILSEFKQHLLSEKDKPNDVDLIMEDVNEFLSICHPA